MQYPSEFSNETKKLLEFWRNIIIEKHKDDDEEIFCSDPLLIIEYNQHGLNRRNITSNDVGQGITVNIILSFSEFFFNFYFLDQ